MLRVYDRSDVELMKYLLSKITVLLEFPLGVVSSKYNIQEKLEYLGLAYQGQTLPLSDAKQKIIRILEALDEKDRKN